MEGKRTLQLMGTKIQLWVSHENYEDLLDEAEKKLISYEQRFSANDSSSDLMKVNRAAGVSPVHVDQELFELISIGKRQSLIKGSSLNIAIGPLIQAWRIGFQDVHYPGDSKIQELLKIINPQKIQLSETEQTVFLEEKGMAIDLGALAKGYFADNIIAFFRQQGARGAFIDLGGNVLTYGVTPTQSHQWRIGIQNPFLPRGNYAAAVDVRNQSIVTSGIYERSFEWNSRTYHHIFNSQTGYPIQTDLASITIISDQSLDGEIWTTRLFGKKATTIIAEINQIPDLEGIVITTQGELAYSKGLVDRIHLF